MIPEPEELVSRGVLTWVVVVFPESFRVWGPGYVLLWELRVLLLMLNVEKS